MYQLLYRGPSWLRVGAKEKDYGTRVYRKCVFPLKPETHYTIYITAEFIRYEYTIKKQILNSANKLRMNVQYYSGTR